MAPISEDEEDEVLNVSPPDTQFIPQPDDDEQLWEAIEITAERGAEYKVRWAGVDPATGKPWAQSWSAKHDCTDDLVLAWKRKQALKKKKKEAKKAGKKSGISTTLKNSRTSTVAASAPTSSSTRRPSRTTSATTSKISTSNAESSTSGDRTAQPTTAKLGPTKRKRLPSPSESDSNAPSPIPAPRNLPAHTPLRKKRKVLTESASSPVEVPGDVEEEEEIMRVALGGSHDDEGIYSPEPEPEPVTPQHQVNSYTSKAKGKQKSTLKHPLSVYRKHDIFDPEPSSSSQTSPAPSPPPISPPMSRANIGPPRRRPKPTSAIKEVHVVFKRVPSPVKVLAATTAEDEDRQLSPILEFGPPSGPISKTTGGGDANANILTRTSTKTDSKDNMDLNTTSNGNSATKTDIYGSPETSNAKRGVAHASPAEASPASTKRRKGTAKKVPTKPKPTPPSTPPPNPPPRIIASPIYPATTPRPSVPAHEHTPPRVRTIKTRRPVSPDLSPWARMRLAAFDALNLEVDDDDGEEDELDDSEVEVIEIDDDDEVELVEDGRRKPRHESEEMEVLEPPLTRSPVNGRKRPSGKITRTGPSRAGDLSALHLATSDKGKGREIEPDTNPTLNSPSPGPNFPQRRSPLSQISPTKSSPHASSPQNNSQQQVTPAKTTMAGGRPRPRRIEEESFVPETETQSSTNHTQSQSLALPVTHGAPTFALLPVSPRRSLISRMKPRTPSSRDLARHGASSMLSPATRPIQGLSFQDAGLDATAQLDPTSTEPEYDLPSWEDINPSLGEPAAGENNEDSLGSLEEDHIGGGDDHEDEAEQDDDEEEAPISSIEQFSSPERGGPRMRVHVRKRPATKHSSSAEPVARTNRASAEEVQEDAPVRRRSQELVDAEKERRKRKRQGNRRDLLELLNERRMHGGDAVEKNGKGRAGNTSSAIRGLIKERSDGLGMANAAIHPDENTNTKDTVQKAGSGLLGNHVRATSAHSGGSSDSGQDSAGDYGGGFQPLEDSMTLQEMEDAYVDLNGGVEGEGRMHEDPLQLREEEEESTQDLLAEHDARSAAFVGKEDVRKGWEVVDIKPDADLQMRADASAGAEIVENPEGEITAVKMDVDPDLGTNDVTAEVGAEDSLLDPAQSPIEQQELALVNDSNTLSISAPLATATTRSPSIGPEISVALPPTASTRPSTPVPHVALPQNSSTSLVDNLGTALQLLHSKSQEISQLEELLAKERVRGQELEREVEILRATKVDGLSNSPAAVAASKTTLPNVSELSQQVAETRDSWINERTGLINQIERLTSDVEQLKYQKTSAEESRDLFREQWSTASAFAVSVRVENEELLQRANIAEQTTRDGLQLIQGTYAERVRLLEAAVGERDAQLALLQEQARRTGVEEMRRRAGAEPQLRSKCVQLEADLEVEVERRERLSQGIEHMILARDRLSREVERLREQVVRLGGLSEMKENVLAVTGEGPVKEADVIGQVSIAGLDQDSDGMVYQCRWRLEGNTACDAVVPGIMELETHMYSVGHLLST